MSPPPSFSDETIFPEDETTLKHRVLIGAFARAGIGGIRMFELAIAFFVTFFATIFLGQALEARLR
jgi:hypothetical protein